MKTYITYHAGCNIWEVEQYDPSIKWHNGCFKGSKEECEEKATHEENITPHYPNAPQNSIWDY